MDTRELAPPLQRESESLALIKISKDQTDNQAIHSFPDTQPLDLWYYLDAQNEAKGPHTFGQLKSMWDHGLLTSETWYCQQGYEEWLPLKTIIHQLEPGNP